MVDLAHCGLNGRNVDSDGDEIISMTMCSTTYQIHSFYFFKVHVLDRACKHNMDKPKYIFKWKNTK
jgi:hypothetical protein